MKTIPKIEILTQQRVYDGYLKIDEAIVVEKNEAGEEIDRYSRFALNRPDAVAVLVYNSDTDTVVLVKQHRYPAQVAGIEEDMFEIPAGKMDGDESPEVTAIRETKEEIGYEIDTSQMVYFNSFLPSPGYSSERIHLFGATVTGADKVSEGGGLDGEHENIEIFDIPTSEFFRMIGMGEIVDGKTIMGAQGLWHLRNDHFIELGKQYQEILRLEKAKELADKVISEEPDADETSK